MNLPGTRLSGRALRTVVAAVRHTPVSHVFTKVVRHQLGIESVRALDDSYRQALPDNWQPIQARSKHRESSESLPPPATTRDWPISCASLQGAYGAGKTTPIEVVEKTFKGAQQLAALNPPHGTTVGL